MLTIAELSDILMRKMKETTLTCDACGQALYDNGEERFLCPFCGAMVDVSRKAREDMTPEGKVERLERELERQKLRADIEELTVADHFWNDGTLFSMWNRESARDALKRGDVGAAKRHLADAKNWYDIGCLLKLILAIAFVLFVLYKLDLE